MDGIPRISICVPCRNTRRFLPERFDSIFKQTTRDWELIVCDSESDDGSWEFFMTFGADERVKLVRVPREGIYAGWNECLKRARGEFVYLATSDDTMSPDCLERLMGALDRYPECGIAHACLTFIDEESRPLRTGYCWDDWSTTRFFGGWMRKEHVRPEGHDTVVALGLRTVYYSMTQVLVRRSVFEQVGFFQTEWDSFGDLEWQMRATLSTQTVHVPEYLATWRVHSEQATQADRYDRAVVSGCFLRMADQVLERSRALGLPSGDGLPGRLRRFAWDEYAWGLWRAERTTPARLRLLARLACRFPILAIRFLWQLLRVKVLRQKPDLTAAIRNELRRLNLRIPGSREVPESSV